MGINNVNTANKAQIIKFALNKKSAQTAQSYKPEYMKMTGSIFNAKTPDTRDARRDELNQLNTKNSINELKAPVASKKNKLDESNFEGIDDVSSGRAAISTGRSATNDVKEQTTKTEKDARTVKTLSKSANKLGDKIKDGDKVFASKLKADQKTFEKENNKIQKLIQESDEHQKQIDDAQHELDTLLASNSFDMGNAHGSSSKNSGRINELQTIIGSKVGLMQKNGKAIYSLQRSQSRTLSRMNKTNKAYINTQKANQKNIKSQENQTNSIIDIAQQIEQYSAIAQAGGQAIGIAGEGLIALGQGLGSTLFGSAAGAAMVTVGTIMKKVGSVLELVGQYGQTAANLTKTAAYAAEGNIMGAMMSCASAIQSGTAAVKSTGQIGKNWKNIDAQANAAKQNIAAKAAAKETVNNAIDNVDKGALAQKLGKAEDQLTKKDITNEALGGMSKKEAKKYIRNDLRNQMAQNNNLTKLSEMQDFANANAGSSFDNSISAFNKNKADTITKMGLTAQKDAQGNTFYTKTITKKDGTVETKIVDMKKINKKAQNSFNAPKLSDKANTSVDWGKNLQNLGSSAMTIATVFMQNQAMNEVSKSSKKHLEPYQMDARTQRIMQRNQRYMRHASYV